MKRAILSILFFLALLSFPHIALADSTPTLPPGWSGSYNLVSPDGRYVLVMLDGVYEAPGKNVSPETDEQNKLLLRYPASGLYRNDGSNTPLWMMQYISWRANITLSSDGHHVVVWGEWPLISTTYGNTALAFYEDGRMLTLYSVRELVVQPEELPHSVSHYHWAHDYSLDDTRGLLNVETYNHEKYLFALGTGKVVSAIIPIVIARNEVNNRRTVLAVSMSTSLALTKVTSTTVVPPDDYKLSMGVLVSAGSLTMIFAGANFLSARARRKAGNRQPSHEIYPASLRPPLSRFHVRTVALNPAKVARRQHGAPKHRPQ